MADEKEYVTLEAFNALQEQLGTLTETLKSFQKLNDGLKKDIKALKTPAAVAAAATSESDDPNTRAIAELRKQNEMLLKRDEERANREKDSNFTNSLRTMLVANGIDAKHVDHAIIYAKSSGTARVDEEGNIVFKVDGVDHTDSKLGVKAWCQTDDAKLYMAPKGTKGAGGATPNSSATGKKPAQNSLEQQEMALREAFGI